MEDSLNSSLSISDYIKLSINNNNIYNDWRKIIINRLENEKYNNTNKDSNSTNTTKDNSNSNNTTINSNTSNTVVTNEHDILDENFINETISPKLKYLNKHLKKKI